MMSLIIRLSPVYFETSHPLWKMIFKSVTQVAQFNDLNSHESPVAQYFNSIGHGISDVQVRCVAQCSQLTFNESSVRCGWFSN